MVFNISSILGRQGVIRAPVVLMLRRLHRNVIPVTWPRPDLGYLKLNYDGSSKGKNGNASIGGLVRNHKAEFLLGYAEPIGRTTGLIAEFTSLKRGLEFVLENGWGNVWLEGDAMTLVQILSSRKRVKSKEILRLVEDINMMIPELKGCMMTHIYREGNRPADKLANMGHDLDKLHVWRDNPPPEVSRFVHEDAEGKIILRKI